MSRRARDRQGSRKEQFTERQILLAREFLVSRT
jgi:hypothetical protein